LLVDNVSVLTRSWAK